jgi:ABC-type thiamin/hydroxymethylpyrimidine transport system permease subunit
MKLTTRELSILAVFGAVWGLVEISLGSVLKSLNVPLSGMILSALGLTVALIGRVYVPRKGSTLFIGVIAMLLKLFSMGGIIIGPMIAIFTEALVAELVLSLFGKPSRAAFSLAGALGVTWTLLQPFVTGPLLFGRSMLVVWLDFIDNGVRLLGFEPQAVVGIVLVMLAIYLVVGALVGWISWSLARQLAQRAGKTGFPVARG